MKPLELRCGRCSHKWTEASRVVPETCPDPTCQTEFWLAELGWDDETGVPINYDAEDTAEASEAP